MKQLRPDNESGLVSLMITMVMMLVITLVVLGFSHIVRHNQRESLDRQLSLQAYYAAESGVNVATPFVKDPSTPVINTLSNGDCNVPSGLTVPTLSANIGVSCLMINTQPNSLVKSPVTQDNPTVIHVKNASTGQAFSNLAFTWTPPTGTATANTSCTAASSKLPTADAWNCSAGILRLDFVPATAGAADFDNAENNVKTVYFVPSRSAALNTSLNIATANTNAYVSRTGCSGITSSGACSSSNCGISNTAACVGLVSGGLGDDYYVRVSTLYRDAGSVVVTAASGASPQIGSVAFSNGQAVIDATGKAQDQYRRIQVRVPLISEATELPLYGVQSQNTICKRLAVAAGSYQNACDSGINGL